MPLELKYQRPWMYDLQENAIFDEARISIIEASTKSGKTVGCLAWLFEQALLNGKVGRNYWWIAPVYGQAKLAYTRMKNSVPRNLYQSNESDLRIKLVNGATIWFKSAEIPDNLYGEDVYAAVLDESSRMREESWHAVRSTLTFTRGPVRMIGNVHGRKNWFYKLARIAEAGEDPLMSYHRITAHDAIRGGVTDQEELDAAERDFKNLGQEGVFRQLYMAEAADDGDNPFGLEAIRACCAGVESLSVERPLAAGVDLAGRGAQNITPRATAPVDRDYTAIVMLDKDGHATCIEQFRLPHTETAARIAQRVKNTRALADSTGTGDAIVENLQRRGNMHVDGFTFTERSRQELLEHLALCIGEGSLRWPDVGDGAKLRTQLETFEITYHRRGVRWSAPDAMHDDLVFALALAAKRMPWRRTRSLAPMSVLSAKGSYWTDSAGGGTDGEAWRKYMDSKKPTTVSGTEEPGNPKDEEGKTVPAPFMVTGSGGGKWR